MRVPPITSRRSRSVLRRLTCSALPFGQGHALALEGFKLGMPATDRAGGEGVVPRRPRGIVIRRIGDSSWLIPSGVTARIQTAAAGRGALNLLDRAHLGIRIGIAQRGDLAQRPADHRLPERLRPWRRAACPGRGRDRTARPRAGRERRLRSHRRDPRLASAGSRLVRRSGRTLAPALRPGDTGRRLPERRPRGDRRAHRRRIRAAAQGLLGVRGDEPQACCATTGSSG